MKGFLINRTGKHKHIFKSLLKPNERLDLVPLYHNIYARKMTETQFLSHVKSTLQGISGLALEELDETPFELPKELADERKAEQILNETLEKAPQMTPSQIASLEYEPSVTKQILDKVNSTRTLTYALTLLRKRNKSKRLQRAIEKRIVEVQSQEG